MLFLVIEVVALSLPFIANKETVKETDIRMGQGKCSLLRPAGQVFLSRKKLGM